MSNFPLHKPGCYVRFIQGIRDALTGHPIRKEQNKWISLPPSPPFSITYKKPISYPTADPTALFTNTQLTTLQFVPVRILVIDP